MTVAPFPKKRSWLDKCILGDGKYPKPLSVVVNALIALRNPGRRPCHGGVAPHGERADRTARQSTRLVCEAAGMVPQLARVADPFGITVMSGGGFDSLTDKYEFAAELADHDRPTEVLHVGDHDPSGVNMFLAFLEDIEAFALDLSGRAIFTRLAVTPEQLRQYSMPTAPPQKTDKRAFSGQTCRAEALAPDALAQILRDAIESRIDLDVLNEVLKREKRVQRQLPKRLAP
jgi:hypothetical protein